MAHSPWLLSYPPLPCGSPPPQRAPSLLDSQACLAASPPEPWVQIPVASAALSLPSAHGWPRGPWLRGGCLGDVPRGPWLRGGLSEPGGGDPRPAKVGLPWALSSQGRCSFQ